MKKLSFIDTEGIILIVVIAINVFGIISLFVSETPFKEYNYAKAGYEYSDEEYEHLEEEYEYLRQEYEHLKEKYEYAEEEHARSCDGSCEHITEVIEYLIDEGELVERDFIFDLYSVYSEDDLQKAYMEGMAEGYVQGYGDCFYGNKQELDISEYSDEEYIY